MSVVSWEKSTGRSGQGRMERGRGGEKGQYAFYTAFEGRVQGASFDGPLLHRLECPSSKPRAVVPLYKASEAGSGGSAGGEAGLDRGNCRRTQCMLMLFLRSKAKEGNGRSSERATIRSWWRGRGRMRWSFFRLGLASRHSSCSREGEVDFSAYLLSALLSNAF